MTSKAAIFTPSRRGWHFTKSTFDAKELESPWRISHSAFELILTLDNMTFFVTPPALETVSLKPGFFWTSIALDFGGSHSIKLDGLPNNRASDLESLIETLIDRCTRREMIEDLSENLDSYLEQIRSDNHGIQKAIIEAIKTQGWVGKEITDHPRPLATVLELLAIPEAETVISRLPEQDQQEIQQFRTDLETRRKRFNASLRKHLLKRYGPLFNSIEKSPLTSEQIQAVIQFDSRLLVVAAAGSGKTSCMVAKAAYAIASGLFKPDEILILAFNRDAAKEVEERIRQRFTKARLPNDGIRVSTFHAFGLDVIGHATGRKPNIAKWVDQGKDLQTLIEIVDEIKDRDPEFREKWDLFRLVFKESPVDNNIESASEKKYWTLNNERVKSRGELLIANWLFYNGIRYEYERPYPVDTADRLHQQYHPDFYLPDIDAYLEHWAIDARGNPPREFHGYKEGMAWKRQLHQKHGTRLLETTMAGVWDGSAFSYLRNELTTLGLVLDPNPDRKAPGRQPIQTPRLVKTFKTFLTHTKNNRLTTEGLRSKLSKSGPDAYRGKLFLDLFEPIREEWERRLKQANAIDFDDMLLWASDLIKEGQWESPYRLVMVDEFQDVSSSRAELIEHLTTQRKTCLFAVGDDWQSINRFAGSDPSIMTQFETRFGTADLLKLETTFRCPQSLCDISSRFVQKNPAQIQKTVRSAAGDVRTPVVIIRVDHKNQIRSAVAKAIADFEQECEVNRQKASILLLGRYNRDKRHVPPSHRSSLVDVDFLTVHRSKGLEADYIILPAMLKGTLGFPSRVEDDPLLGLAMSQADETPYAEERRLFYVALTRARKRVALITVKGEESDFVKEIQKDFNIPIYGLNGQEISVLRCPSCGVGEMVVKNGRYGKFLGCSTYPRCTYTQNLA